MKKNVFAKLVLIAAAGFAVNASAATATSNFQVLMKINKVCTVAAGAGSNIQLGVVGGVDSSATNTSGTSNISVTCSKNTPYYIGLTPSNSSTTGAGVMAAQNVAPVTGNTDAVPYQLNSVSATGSAWGNTATTTAVGNGLSGTGNGLVRTIPVFATAPSANFTPDNYADTVTVTVNY
ncbi:MAG: Spore coat domain protein [Polaromonas sp.]|nr:Spore coat domain protein [Polaromonas sp.]